MIAMTVLHSLPSRRTVITSIQRLNGDEPGLPDELQEGTIYAIDAIVEGKQVRFFYVDGRLGGSWDYAISRIYGLSGGVRTVLLPFVEGYVRGRRHDEFPVDLGLV
jgi:hypothetical protein